jgi:hypothetical protein
MVKAIVNPFGKNKGEGSGEATSGTKSTVSSIKELRELEPIPESSILGIQNVAISTPLLDESDTS